MPQFKLPALYVLDSIVKNVGTPYTVYLGRNLYRTFMSAYSVVPDSTRKAMEGLVRTWKQPVPESMDPRPVFSSQVTGDIEDTLNKMRAAQMQTAPAQRPVHALPPRPVTNAAWRNTPTPPQNGHFQGAPPDPRMRSVSSALKVPENLADSRLQQYPPTPQYGQYTSPVPANAYGQPQVQNQPVSSVDLEDLKGEVARSIADSEQAFAYSPADANLKQRLDALKALKTMLNTKALTPQSLRDIQTQIRNLAPLPGPVQPPAYHAPPSVPPPNMYPSMAAPPPFPPASAPPINIAQLLASMRPSVPPVANPVAAPLTPNLADLLRRVSSPGQSSSTPTVAPFHPPAFPAPSQITTPVQVPAVPVPAPTGTPTVNLAQLLAQFGKPAAAPPMPVPQHSQTPSASHPQMFSQPPAAGPAIGSSDWLVNALKGLPTNGTPINTTPMASEPMTRQPSAPTSVLGEIELTTAAMKK
jgi:pre-mRNA cleavage complex 2 protein Pcf11